MYTIDGQSVKSLNDIKDGGMYVASGGDSFKKVPYLTQDDPVQEPPLKSRENKIKSRPHHSYGMLNSDINNIFNQKEKAIFGPSVSINISKKIDKGIQGNGFRKWSSK